MQHTLPFPALLQLLHPSSFPTFHVAQIVSSLSSFVSDGEVKRTKHKSTNLHNDKVSMLASIPLFSQSPSTFTHSPVCLFSVFPCSATSSFLSLFSHFQNECLAERWGQLHSLEMNVSCHLQKLLSWHAVEYGNLGPSCYKLCRMGFGLILQPVGCAVVISLKYICVTSWNTRV